jgi:hypothetical protein
MPPVSVTMQPTNLADVVLVLLGVVLDGDPQAASTAAATLVTAKALIRVLNRYLLDARSAMPPLRPPA